MPHPPRMGPEVCTTCSERTRSHRQPRPVRLASSHHRGRNTRRRRVATDLERFVKAKGRAAKIAEVRKRIDAEGIQYVYYQFPSVTGRIMGKGVPAQHWEKIAQDG